MKERIEYFDIAKGLMIILLVFHHFPHAVGFNGINLECMPQIICWHEWFIVFFMQGFFLITGFCSNFDKPFKKFLITNVKQLVLPAILFTVILRLFSVIVFCKTNDERWAELLNGSNLWFLWALFIGKMIHLYGRRYKYLYPFVALFLVFVAFVCTLWLKCIPNVFFFINAFACTIFLLLGEYLKKYSQKHDLKPLFYLGTCIFVGSMIFLIHFNLPRPILTGSLVVGSMKELPLYIWLAFWGSMSILCISSLIGKCSFLSGIGMNTLIIYCVHSRILILLVRFLDSCGMWDKSHLSVYITHIIVCFVALILSYYMALAIAHFRSLRFLTGKW